MIATDSYGNRLEIGSVVLDEVAGHELILVSCDGEPYWAVYNNNWDGRVGCYSHPASEHPVRRVRYVGRANVLPPYNEPVVQGYKRGDIIKVGPWCGVVLDVLRSDRQTVLEVDFVKNAQRGERRPEFIKLPPLLPIEFVDRAALEQELCTLVTMQQAYVEKMLENAAQPD